MHKLCFEIDPEFDRLTLEAFLKKHKGMSTRTLKKLKHTDGGLLRNGEHIRSIDIIRSGDIITLTFKDEPQLLPSADVPIDIVYEDDDFLLCNKSGNIPTHPSLAHPTDSLANGVSAYLESLGHIQTVRIINRLDKDTSGLVLIAKHQYSACAVAGKVKKTYFAIVEGETLDEGIIDAPIRRKVLEGKERIVADDGERAITEYKTLAREGTTSLVKVNLVTGRTHQIRVHFAYIGHPLIGDSLYNGKSSDYISRQALHCGIIEWENVIRNKNMKFSADFPSDFKNALQKLRYNYSVGEDK